MPKKNQTEEPQQTDALLQGSDTTELPDDYYKEFHLEPALLRACAPAMSTEQTRYYLNGVHIFERDDQIVYEATNGHFCIRITSELPQAGNHRGLDVIVPRQFVTYLSTPKFLHTFGAIGLDFVTAVIDGRTIQIEMTDGIASNKLVDGTFPTIDAVIPKHRRGTKETPIYGVDLEYMAKIAKSAKIFHSRQVEIALSDNVGPVYFSQKNERGMWEAILMPARV